VGCNVGAKPGPWRYRVLTNHAAAALLSPSGRQTASRKLAVFQVSEGGTRANLVCLEMHSLQSAAELEHWLRMNIGPKTEVTLLGRFDSVHFCSETEVESLVLGDLEHLQSAGQQLHSRPSKWARVAVLWDTWRKALCRWRKT
jgi:hypothetical protein